MVPDAVDLMKVISYCHTVDFSNTFYVAITADSLDAYGAGYRI